MALGLKSSFRLSVSPKLSRTMLAPISASRIKASQYPTSWISPEKVPPRKYPSVGISA